MTDRLTPVVTAHIDTAGEGEGVVGAGLAGDLPRRIEGEAPLVVVAARGEVVDQRVQSANRIVAVLRAHCAVEPRVPYLVHGQCILEIRIRASPW